MAGTGSCASLGEHTTYASSQALSKVEKRPCRIAAMPAESTKAPWLPIPPQPCSEGQPGTLAFDVCALVDTLLAWPEEQALGPDVLCRIYNQMYAAQVPFILHQMCHCIVDLIRLRVHHTALSSPSEACRHAHLAVGGFEQEILARGDSQECKLSQQDVSTRTHQSLLNTEGYTS